MSIAAQVLAGIGDCVATTFISGYGIFADKTMYVFEKPTDVQVRRNADGATIYAAYTFSDKSVLEMRRDVDGSMKSRTIVPATLH